MCVSTASWACIASRGKKIMQTVCLIRKLIGTRETLSWIMKSLLPSAVMSLENEEWERAQYSNEKFWPETKINVKPVEGCATTYPSPISVCLFSFQTTALRHTVCHPFHGTLQRRSTDYRRSEKIPPAVPARAPNQLPWWSDTHISDTVYLRLLHYDSMCNSVVMRTPAIVQYRSLAFVSVSDDF